MPQFFELLWGHGMVNGDGEAKYQKALVESGKAKSKRFLSIHPSTNCDNSIPEKIEIISMFERLLSRQEMKPEDRYVDYHEIKKIMKIIHNDIINL